MRAVGKLRGLLGSWLDTEGNSHAVTFAPIPPDTAAQNTIHAVFVEPILHSPSADGFAVQAKRSANLLG